ncbi:hypothetical protein RCL_jg8547.t1 [Rhizophagus clarus]|uniref:Uncharacterized protein n=1 Tax=Rhizophagus clarus TaxID=94130 RepID=A0A8H3KWG7_9GLOM|nr:hypothetical protein RCL_jg8547.t1 [Rhizophagus clarus]
MRLGDVKVSSKFSINFFDSYISDSTKTKISQIGWIIVWNFEMGSFPFSSIRLHRIGVAHLYHNRETNRAGYSDLSTARKYRIRSNSSARGLFHELSRPQFHYPYIRPDLPIQFLWITHFFPVFLPSFLKYYVGNDILPIVSLAPYFHWKAHYILLHFARLMNDFDRLPFCFRRRARMPLPDRTDIYTSLSGLIHFFFYLYLVLLGCFRTIASDENHSYLYGS